MQDIWGGPREVWDGYVVWWIDSFGCTYIKFFFFFNINIYSLIKIYNPNETFVTSELMDSIFMLDKKMFETIFHYLFNVLSF